MIYTNGGQFVKASCFLNIVKLLNGNIIMKLQQIKDNIAFVDDEMQFEMSRRYREIEDKRLLMLEKLLKQYEPIDIYNYNCSTNTEVELCEDNYMLRLFIYVERKTDYETKDYFYIYDVEFWDDDAELLDLTEDEQNLLKRYLK